MGSHAVQQGMLFLRWLDHRCAGTMGPRSPSGFRLCIPHAGSWGQD